MKKLLLTVTAGAFAFAAQAQLPVGTAPSKKRVVLEEFTGLYCGWCPDGHKLGNNLKKNKPEGDVILINIHTGGYAQVDPNDADDLDLRTSEGATISNISGMNISGYPTGSVNRKLFSGEAGFAVNRGSWNSYANQILAEDAYVNVAIEGVMDEASRELTITVESYYTETTTTPNNITVLVLEDSLRGNQSGATSLYPAMVGSDGLYTHMHALRKVLTNAKGDLIASSETVQGNKVTKTYTWTVPATILNTTPILNNLSVVAFIAEGESEIINGAESHVVMGSTSVKNILDEKSVNVYPNPTSGNFNISIEDATPGKASIEIFDALGRNVYQNNIELYGGKTIHNLETASFNSGIYNVVVKTAKGSISKKVTVAH